MPRALYECTAAELATRSVGSLPRETAPDEAAAWLTEKGYDAAPVSADGDLVGFLYKDDVTTEDTGETLAEYLTPLTIDYMISGDAGVPAILAALMEYPVYFLGGHNHVTGVLTRADLNTAPTRIYLYDRITYLEELLRELILDTTPEWKDTPVTVGELDDIEARYEDAQAANVALDEIHYAQFSTLKTIITSVTDCWEVCGFSTKATAESRLHEVTQLRNDVAHANLLVQNTASDSFLNSGRTTENLSTILDTITDVLSALHEAGYDSDPTPTGTE